MKTQNFKGFLRIQVYYSITGRSHSFNPMKSLESHDLIKFDLNMYFRFNPIRIGISLITPSSIGKLVAKCTRFLPILFTSERSIESRLFIEVPWPKTKSQSLKKSKNLSIGETLSKLDSNSFPLTFRLCP